MATASVGGLASGLDTASIISQLMSLEALPQAKLKTQVTTTQSKVSALQQLNARLQTLAAGAGALVPTATTPGTWAASVATSSNTGVSVTTSSSASPASFAVTIGATALTHQLAFTEAHSRTDVVTGATGSVLLKRAGEADVEITTAGGTLEELAEAINGADAGVRATLVRTGSAGGTDQFRLLVESRTTGAGESFELTDSSGADLLGGAAVRAGRDATIDIGGITATSTTNTFADVVPGVTITLAASATGTADLTVTRDGTSRGATLKSLVSDLNGLLGQIQTVTASSSTSRGTLASDSTVRQVAARIGDTLYPGDGTSLAAYGVEVDRYGKFTFDEEVFAKAYAADPDAVTAAFAGPGGFADRVKVAAEAASDKYTGSLTGAISSHTATISRLNQSIESWDGRLELRRSTLERQYTALETALSQMQAQSSWLTSQLASLTSSSE